jgi:LacI family transcriptional regulator
MAATLRDICTATGLSTATVSRVLNNSPLVKENTRERVQKVMADLNYFPLASARALAGKRTGSIGIISPYVGSGFFSDIMVGVDRVATERGVHVMMSFAHGVGDEKRLVTRFIQERSVDAVILINLDMPHEFLAEVKNDKIPLVSVDTPAVEQGIPSVSIGNRKGAHAMMAHLLEHGYQDIVVFAGPELSYDSCERLAGCKAAAAEAGTSLPDEKIFAGSFIMKSGREFMQKILDSGKPLPDAVFALNDVMAFGAMACLREAGLRVPEDIAVAGFDDSEAAPLVGLTTVAVPLLDMGRHAAEMALDARDGTLEKQHITVQTKLIVRDSCGCTT